MEANKQDQEYSPYCPICSACGVEGCCSPLSCQQHPDGDHCGGYLVDMKFGYHMNVWLFNNLLDKIPEDLKHEYMKEWDEQFPRFYHDKND